jgi:hypothetical protein
MDQAIGLLVPGKKGMTSYSRSALRYDIHGDRVDRTDPSRRTRLRRRARPEETPDRGTEDRSPVEDGGGISGERAQARGEQRFPAEDIANAAVFAVEQALEEADALTAAASTTPIWKASDSAINDKAPGITAEEVPLRKRNQRWSASYLIEKSLEFNKKYKSMEQLLAYQPWDLCRGFI